MRFKDIDTARDLFDGHINAVAAVGLGDVCVGGMISQLDNVNRILDRVALYLA
jgi:fructose-1-phosphate kinase PfkB-like protein